MKKIKLLKLHQVSQSKLSQKDLNKLKAGAGFCVDYNCQCHGTTFTSATTKAVLDYDSRG